MSVVEELTESLLASYKIVGGINHLDGKNLPSKRAIAKVTQDLLRLLFPGYFDEKVVRLSQVRALTRGLADSVTRRLETEIRRSLEYAPPAGASRRDLHGRARELSARFMRGLPEARAMLQTDMESAYSGDPAALSREEVMLAYPFVEAIAVQRMAHRLYLDEVALIPRIMTEWAHGRTGLDLHPGAEIGTHFFVDHCTGTVVGETTRIGSHVRMYQGVGLVARSLAAGQALRGQKRHPTIEDRVTIYAGATIMGGDTVVGAGSTVGANVFLTHSVPPNSLVLAESVEVRVLQKSEAPQTPDFQI